MNASFDKFMRELNEFTPPVDYVWSPEKAKSAQWIVDRIVPKSVGVDVGGTEWMCEQLAAKECDVTYYDWFAPKSFPKAIQGDMMDVMSHFAEGALDFIATRHTLEHSLCPMFQLWAYNRLLKPEGKLFVIVPQHIREWIWFPTHHSPLPRENWLMLFYRAGFRLVTSDAGTWTSDKSQFIEYRFELQVETRKLRMDWQPHWLSPP